MAGVVVGLEELVEKKKHISFCIVGAMASDIPCIQSLREIHRSIHRPPFDNLEIGAYDESVNDRTRRRIYAHTIHSVYT